MKEGQENIEVVALNDIEESPIELTIFSPEAVASALGFDYEIIDLNTENQRSTTKVYRLRGNGKDWVYKEIDTGALEVEEIHFLTMLKEVKGIQKLVGICPENNSLLTEYAGPSLNNVKQDRQFVLQVTRQIAGIIDRLSSLNVYHNDIKSHNICVSSKPEGYEVTLIDFGLASTTNPTFDQEFTKKEIETYFWIAPEILQNQCSSPASDVYGVAHALEVFYPKILDSIPLLNSWIRRSKSTEIHKRPSIHEIFQILPHSSQTMPVRRRKIKRNGYRLSNRKRVRFMR